VFRNGWPVVAEVACGEEGCPNHGPLGYAFERQHAKHSTLDNTIVWVDGEYVEPKLRAGRVVVPRPPVRSRKPASAPS
jgi:hypothetical protein